MNPELITNQVVDLTKDIAKFLKEESARLKSSDILEKGVHNLVTYVDKESERRIVDELRKILPEAGFIAEEDDSLERSDIYNWVIDPLDGTTNYIHGLPVYSISIALMERNEVVLGVVMEVNLDECFYTWKGAPTFLNGKPVSVSATDKLDASLLATGFPYYNYSLLEPYLGLFKDLMEKTRGLRRLGSAAADLAYVACGRFEVFYEYGLQPWDVAAGVLLVKNAGGKVSDFNGSDDYIFGKHLIASNGTLHEEFNSEVRNHFGDNVKI